MPRSIEDGSSQLMTRHAMPQAHFLDLLYYPQNWYDNRPQLDGSRRPDFKHKTQEFALWLEDPGRRVRCANPLLKATV